MQRGWLKFLRTRRQQKTQRGRRPLNLTLERLEERTLLAANASAHVLIISIDGLHEADVTDPALQPYLTNITGLEQSGVTYTNASTTTPSDSYPATMAYLTGANPGTTGVFYDDTYSRTLLPPGSNSATPPGTPVNFDDGADKNSSLLSGGGNFDASSLDPTQLPVNPATNQVVYPNQFLQVNTIFDVAHNAGLYTAFIDKHPSYEIAEGNNPAAINDLYTPEIVASTALLDNATGLTVNANALLMSAGPFVDLSNYTLVDPSTDPMGANDPNLIPDGAESNILLAMKYDDLKVQAVLNEIQGLPSHTFNGSNNSQIPNLFAMDFQAVSVAEQDTTNAIALLPNGQEGPPSAILEAALQHTDQSIGEIVAALKAQGIWNSTELYVTSKYGQDPRVGTAGLMDNTTLPNLLNAAGAPVATATQDDGSLIWLQNQADTATAMAALQNFKQTGTLDVYFEGVEQTLPASEVINQILSGSALVQAGLGNPATDSTTPDIVVTLQPGYIWVDDPTNFSQDNAEHGGFQQNDTHIPLIVTGGLVSPAEQGTTQTGKVETTQIAVSALQALGLNPNDLQGVQEDGTQALPGLNNSGTGGQQSNQGGQQSNQGGQQMLGDCESEDEHRHHRGESQGQSQGNSYHSHHRKMVTQPEADPDSTTSHRKHQMAQYSSSEKAKAIDDVFADMFRRR